MEPYKQARIKNIAGYKKPGFWIIVLVVVLTVALLVAFTANPKQPAADANLSVAESEDSNTTATIAGSGTVSRSPETFVTSTAAAAAQPYPITSKSLSAMKSYKSILQNKTKFFSTGENKEVYLKDFHYFNGEHYGDIQVTNFTIVDMDGDNIPEMVLKQNSDMGSEVLHYENGKVYGYNFVYRALETLCLKTDGTFPYSDGVPDHGYSRLQFSKSTYKTEVFAYCKPVGENNDGTIESYFINGKSVAEEAFNLFQEEQEAKDSVAWYDLTEQNIEAQLPV